MALAEIIRSKEKKPTKIAKEMQRELKSRITEELPHMIGNFKGL